MQEKDLLKNSVHQINLEQIRKAVLTSRPHKRKSRKLLFSVSSLVAASLVALAIFLPSFLKNSTPAAQIKNLESKSEIIAFSSISSIQMLKQESNNQLKLRQNHGNNENNNGNGNHNNHSNEAQTTELTPEQLEMINFYLNSFESFLNDEPFTFNVLESDLETYVYKEEIILKDLEQNEEVYTFYYNEEANTQPRAIKSAHNSSNAHQNSNNHRGNIDNLLAIDGILIIGEDTYHFTGQKISDDDGEKITFTTRIDETSYIKVVLKVEDNEQKFSFDYVSNGISVSKSEVKIKINNNRTKISLIKDTNEINFSKGIKNDKIIINISALIDNVPLDIQVLISVDDEGNNIYQYLLTNGNSYSSNRNHGC